MQYHFLVLGLLGSVAASGNADTTPVEKVVNMLTDLKGKITGDGKAEEQMYNKYACWCETTTKRKAGDINQAQADLRSLGQQILKLKGKVATLGAEIKELMGQIEENESEQEAATSLREKRNGKFMAMQSETKQAIAGLEKAIDVLVKGSSLMQTDAGVQATSAVQSVLEKLPAEAQLNADNMATLFAFLQSGSEYAPQSATIQGILGDMYATFAKNLEDATSTEATQNANYEKLTATLVKQHNELNDTKSRKETQMSDAESDLADTTATYDDTTDQLKADIAFFDQTKDACNTKHTEWELRSKLRTEELEGVSKALEFLSSDEARDLFAKSIKPGQETSFLQIAEEDAQAVSFKAYGMLKAQATKAKSLRMAMLAVQVRTAKAGHFGAVMKAITDMVTTLNEEGEADRAKKNQCNDEYQNIAQTLGDLDWKIKNNEATIDKKESLIEMRTKEKAETLEQIQDTKDYKDKITGERNEEHDAFKRAKSDDEAAIVLLNKAKDALTAFYKNNDVEMGKIQGSMLQADPEFAISKDQAPEADFSSKSNRKGMNKGVVSMMDMIIQDLEHEVVNDGKNEAESQAAYEAETNTADELQKTLEAKDVSLKEIIAKRGDEKTTENTDMKNNIKERDLEQSYKDKITPDCDWIKKNFSGRATARDAEMAGLVSAKEFLAGKTALLQTKVEAPVQKHNVAEDRLAGIKFLGVQ